MLAKVIVITCSKPHAGLWAELGGTYNDKLKQLTRRIYKELHVTHDNLAEQKAVVTSMRQLVVDMHAPAKGDSEDMFSKWDGIGAVSGNAGSSRGCSRSRRRLKQDDVAAVDSDEKM